jgi:8-oxo-dGTP pyrophosphatase MutT (NUDIX family)/predicted HAD superfamily phosphohydrolase YqeG
MNKRIIFFDGDGTLWYPKATKRTRKPHWVYHDIATKDNFLEHIELTPKTKETLQFFSEQGVYLVVISANPESEDVAIKEMREKLEYFGIEKLFYACRVSAGDDPNGKSSIILEILEELNLKKEDAVMVGDSFYYDYLAAKNIGIDALFIENTVSKMPMEIPADLQGIREISDLLWVFPGDVKLLLNPVFSLIKKFNLTGEQSYLVSLLSFNDLISQDFLDYLNSKIDQAKLISFALLPLKMVDDYIVYISSEGNIVKSEVDLKSIYVVLNKSRAVNSQYRDDLFALLLIASGGAIRTQHVFSRSDISSHSKEDIREMMKSSKFWLKERLVYHSHLISVVMEDVRHLSRLMKKNISNDFGICIVGGAIASGKTTFSRSFFADKLEINEDLKGFISTDYIKKILAKDFKNIFGCSVPTYLFHDEASMLCDMVLSRAISEALFYCVDKRFKHYDDLKLIIEDSQKREVPITVFEINSDFMTSSMRVLRRSGVYPGDPAPDYKNLIKNFQDAEKGNKALIPFFLESNLIKNYFRVSCTKNNEFLISAVKQGFELLESIPSMNGVKYNFNAKKYENILLSSGFSLKEALDQHAREIYLGKYDKLEYYDNFIHNIRNTSRTYNGEFDTSASSDKKARFNNDLSSEEISVLTGYNLASAFNFVYNNRHIPLIQAAFLRHFIDSVATIVNQGMIIDVAYLFRTGVDSEKYNYISTKNIGGFYCAFIEQLYEKISSKDFNPIDVAAWIEWNIDFSGHIFSDGCSRVAKLISSWLLMRSNHQLPDYVFAQDEFSTVRESYKKRFSLKKKIKLKKPTNNEDYEKFLRYYRRLFRSNSVNEKILASGGLVYDADGRFLILQTTKGKDYGKWVLPGGKMELGESSLEAFKREVLEEIEMEIGNVNLLGFRDYTAVSGNHYGFFDYEAQLKGDADVHINAESMSHAWILPTELDKYTFADSIENFFGKHFLSDSLNYYLEKELINSNSLDTPHFSEHTMSLSLEKYICKKMPAQNLLMYAPLVSRVEIHGIYPDIKLFKKVMKNVRILKIISQSGPKPGNSNSLRPLFLLVEDDKKRKILICCVTPGRDLLLHYASMVTYVLKKYSNLKISTFAYPFAEAEIDKWTNLDENFIFPGDTVIMGYSTFFKNKLFQDANFSLMTTNENQFYTTTRFLCDNGSVVNCLEANYGHWGNISDRLAKKMCQLGAQEIIHIGKVGTFVSSKEVYQRVYIPSRFLVGRRSEILCSDVNIKNSLSYIEEYISQVHVSVATTMEETFKQRNNLKYLNVETIDIESSKIAQAVSNFNISSVLKVKFGAIHFSSDYLKGEDEVDFNPKYDLSTERMPEANHKKELILNKIYELVKYHIMNV